MIEPTSEFGMGFELNHKSTIFSDVDPDDLQPSGENAVGLDTCRKELSKHIILKVQCSVESQRTRVQKRMLIYRCRLKYQRHVK